MFLPELDLADTDETSEKESKSTEAETSSRYTAKLNNCVRVATVDNFQVATPVRSFAKMHPSLRAKKRGL